MTTTKQVLELLSKGNLTYAEIRQTLSLEDAYLRSVIGYLQRKGYIESAPITYALSFDGFQRLKHKPKSTARELAKERARRERMKTSSRLRSKGVVNSVFNQGAMT